MEFLGMGMGEILLILAVALIIFGPGKIPEIARTLGKLTRALRKTTFDFTSAVTKELDKEGKDSLSQSRANSSDKTKKLSDVDKAKPGGAETAGLRDH